LFKARRIKDAKEIYQPMAHILKTLTRDHNQRPRDLKPGEEAETLWDELQNPMFRMAFGKATLKEAPSGFDRPEATQLPKGWTYTEADAQEDAILFPEELIDPNAEQPVQEASSSLDAWERRGPSLKRLVYDMESDEESDDYSDPNDEPRVEVDRESEADSDLNEIQLKKFNPNATPAEVWSVEAIKSERKSWDLGFVKLLECLMTYVEEPSRAPDWLKRDQTFKWMQKWDDRNLELEMSRLNQGAPMAMTEFMDSIQRDKSGRKSLDRC
jgi:hypothetical protein